VSGSADDGIVRWGAGGAQSADGGRGAVEGGWGPCFGPVSILVLGPPEESDALADRVVDACQLEGREEISEAGSRIVEAADAARRAGDGAVFGQGVAQEIEWDEAIDERVAALLLKGAPATVGVVAAEEEGHCRFAHLRRGELFWGEMLGEVHPSVEDLGGAVGGGPLMVLASTTVAATSGVAMVAVAVWDFVLDLGATEVGVCAAEEAGGLICRGGSGDGLDGQGRVPGGGEGPGEEFPLLVVPLGPVVERAKGGEEVWVLRVMEGEGVEHSRERREGDEATLALMLDDAIQDVAEGQGAQRSAWDAFVEGGESCGGAE